MTQTLQIASAKNATLTTSSGAQLVDMNAGFGVAAIGYSNPKWVEALSQRAATLSHGIAPVVPHVFADEAAARVQQALQRDDACILTSGGAEAIEVALKIARITTGRSRVLTFSGAYHGQSIGTLGLTSQSAVRDPLHGLFSYADVAPFPNVHGAPASAADLASLERHSLDYVEFLLSGDDGGGRDIGAVLIEPMQNFSGYRNLPDRYGEDLSKICKAAGALLIADEVFVGFGRCGYYELSPSVGLSPDIQCFGKAMTGGFPAGACVGPASLLSCLEPAQSPHLHSPTFANSPLANVAVATAVECLIAIDAPTRAIAIGETIREGLTDLLGDYAWLVDIRGHGAAQALVVSGGRGRSPREYTSALRAAALQEGVLVLDSGSPWGNTIALCPPLIIDQDELDFALRGLRRAVTQVDSALGRH